MKIIKRSGAEVTFDLQKIIAAIGKANDSVKEEVKDDYSNIYYAKNTGRYA